MAIETSDITLKELKAMRDWLPLRQVRVKPEQRKFASMLVVSYLQSSHAAVTTFGIYLGETVIGYVMLIHAENPAQWIIERLTIDRDYQRQGYGYHVADQLIDMIHEFENSEMVIARYDTDNDAARQLFVKLKFEQQEQLVRKRNIALLEFEFEEIEEDDAEDEEVDVGESDDTEDEEAGTVESEDNSDSTSIDTDDIDDDLPETELDDKI